MSASFYSLFLLAILITLVILVGALLDWFKKRFNNLRLKQELIKLIPFLRLHEFTIVYTSGPLTEEEENEILAMIAARI